MEVFVFTHREFSYKSVGERILKIGPHLPNYYQTSSGFLFLEHGVHINTVCQFAKFCYCLQKIVKIPWPTHDMWPAITGLTVVCSVIEDWHSVKLLLAHYK